MDLEGKQQQSEPVFELTVMLGPLHFLNFHAFICETAAIIPALQAWSGPGKVMGVKDTVNSEDLPLRLISKKGCDVPAQLLLELLDFPRDQLYGAPLCHQSI